MFDTLKVNESSGVPVWIQIRNQLLFLIRSGQLAAGDTLPTVRELAVRLGVNYNTIHKVYQDLETDGLINSGRGKRSTVAEVDLDTVDLPDSPIDAIVAELVRAAKDASISKEDVLSRVSEAFD